jgi:hypothetical protein
VGTKMSRGDKKIPRVGTKMSRIIYIIIIVIIIQEIIPPLLKKCQTLMKNIF